MSIVTFKASLRLLTSNRAKALNRAATCWTLAVLKKIHLLKHSLVFSQSVSSAKDLASFKEAMCSFNLRNRLLNSVWQLGPPAVCVALGVCRNLVDPASSHMLVSKIKPCMSQYKLLYGETANGSLKQL